MSRRTIISLWVVLMIATVLLTACGKKNPLEKSIIGSWKGQFQDRNATFEFLEGGKLYLHAEITPDMVVKLDGTYQFSDNDTLSLKITYNTQTVEGKHDIVIEGDQMTLTNPDTGEKQMLTRVE